MIELQFQRLHRTSQLPSKATEAAAGYDVFAFIRDRDDRSSKLLVPRQNVRAIPTGIALHPPPEHLVMVCSRSGLAKDRCLFVANAPGIIDPDYTGELIILLYNGGFESHYIEDGQRIAQLVVVKLATVSPITVEKMPETLRGPKGFGSTGR
jgi:dUTP pyrophosphatase